MGLWCCDIADGRGFGLTADPETKAALQRHVEIQKYLTDEEKERKRIFKALLLGSRGSGKSTVTKQMRIIYSTGFSEEERRQARPVIIAGFLKDFKNLLDFMDCEGVVFGTESVKSSVNLIQNAEPGDSLDRTLCDSMKDVWQDSDCRQAVSGTRILDLYENLLYFFNSIDRLADPCWLPSNQDMVQARSTAIQPGVSTISTISEFSFNLPERSQMTWNMVNLRNSISNRKWMHYFDDIHVVLFVAPLSDYDQYLIEDSSQSHMHEWMVLFDSVINSQRFMHKSVILFLNKCDLFKKKIAVSPLSKHFPDFEGSDTDASAPFTYFKDRFQNLNRNPGRRVYTYFTTANDTSSMKFVMEAVHDTMMSENIPMLLGVSR